MKRLFTLSALLIFYFQTGYGQAGQLDSSFGNNGIVKTDIGAKFPYTRYVRQILSLPNESMYVVEEFKGLSKRLSNGSLDSNYGLNGYAREYISRAVVQSDGKLVAIGAGGLGRYNTNGQRDSSFSKDGKQVTELTTFIVTIQKDGKIVVAGELKSYLSLARYNTDGSPDSTFGGNGLVQSAISFGYSPLGDRMAIALQNDGKIVVAGNFSIVRFNTNGTQDTSFNGNGIHAFQAYSSIAIQKDGKIAATSLTYDEETGNVSSAVVRLNTDGSLDKSFSDDGIQPTDFVVISLALQKDQKIVTGGGNDIFAVARYKTNGELDSTFSADGKQMTDFQNGPSSIETVVIQSDGKILAGGSTYFTEYIAIARYNQNGDLDKSFDEDGKLVDATKVGRTAYKSTAIQKDGKVVVAGTTYSGSSSEENLAIARYNTDGSLDSAFGKKGVLITGITTVGDYAINVVVQSDGKIVAASEDARILVRYNNDGSTDSSFVNNERQRFRSLALQSDGKIVVESYTEYGTFEVTRFNTNGSPDAAFGQNGKQSVVFDGMQGYFTSLSIDSNGKIVVGGIASNDYPYGNSLVGLARLNTDGSFDNTFSNDGKTGFSLDGATSSLLAIQNNGKIVIGSAFADLNSHEGVILKRFNYDGSIDSSFNGNTPLHYNLYSVDRTSIAIQNDGKILLGGSDLLRFNADGGLDSTFDATAGKKVDFYINDIAIADKKLYAAGGGIFGSVARYLLDNDTTNAPPTVSITTPADNAVYTVGTYIKVNATATDADGTITKLELYSDSTLLYTQTVIPFGFQLKHLPVGKYTITVKAYDNSGNVTTSAPVYITVVENQAPVVSVTTPANNAVYRVGDYIKVNAATTDADGTITKVEFYADSTLLHTETEAPYGYQLKHLTAGTYTITAKATDNLGLSATSAPVTITVSDASIVSSKPYSQNEKTVLKDALSVRVFPNPATQIVNLQIGGLQPDKPATISIISNAGIVLQNINISNATQTTQLNVSTLAKGVYTIKIVSKHKLLYKQFVKL